MNDKKSFQLFHDDGEETKEDIKESRSSALSIVILLLVIAGAVAVLVFAITRQSSKAPLRMTQDPNMRELEPRQFMIDLVTNIRGFNDLLESIDEQDAFLDTEVAFADFIAEMENIANQSLGPSKEPKEEEREELYEMLGELEIEVCSSILGMAWLHSIFQLQKPQFQTVSYLTQYLLTFTNVTLIHPLSMTCLVRCLN